MNILLIGGFLGSGKTTLLLYIAKTLSDLSKSVAIIENEIGDIGIDGKIISRQGLELRELYGGCVCCTMRTDLRTTLEKIEKTIKPEWVLLEPTGAAYPGDVIKNLMSDVDFVQDYRVVIIIDPLRFDMLKVMMTPMLEAQLESADVVVINKIDQIEESKAEKVTKSLRDMLKHDKKILPISAEMDVNLENLVKELI